MSFNGTHAALNQYNVNRGGYIDQNELNQWRGAGAVNYQPSTAQTYPTDAQGLYIDPNPLIIRRQLTDDVPTYTQNVIIRYLQPPPVPPPGPLIIKEVRPPQPPAPPPLIIRQQAPPYPTPPPLILRQRPPNPPYGIGADNFMPR